MKKFFILLLLTLFFLPSVMYGGEISDLELIQFVHQKAMEYDISVEVIFAIGIAESNWKNIQSGYNRDGSRDIGIMQLNSKYISYYEEAFWYRDESFDPWNPKHNIEMAVMYLEHLYSYTNDYQEAIQAYNRGLHSVRKNENAGVEYLARVSRAMTNIEIFTDDYIYYGDM